MISRLRTFLFSTLRRQLIFSVAVVYAILTAFFLFDAVKRQETLILERQVEHASVLSESLATSAGGWITTHDVSGLQELVAVLKGAPDLAFAMILDEQGRVLAHTDPGRIGQYVGDLPAPGPTRTLCRSRELVDVVASARLGTRHVGWARIGLDQRATGLRLAQLKRDGLLYATGAILVGSLFAWLMARRITRRLAQIQHTVDRVHQGDPTARTQVDGQDEAATLGAEFNRMLDALEERARERDRAQQEQARLQSQLLQAQKMDSLGSLAGGIAHDMNNVLGAILLLASSNREDLPAPEAAKDDFGTIAEAALRGRSMVDGLLRFARQDPVEVKSMDLNGLVVDEMRLLERTTLARIQVVLDLDPDLKPMSGDANALSQVLMNLCVNAMDAITGYGMLTLRTRNLGEDRVAVSVEDTGCGMPPEVLAKAFDPFYTTKPQGKGTGLGLAMVYSTVKAHQGQVEVRSEPGRGTCFQLTFPASAPAPVPQEAAPAAAEAMERSFRILLVDDDDMVRESLRAVLGTLGHEVTPASLGEEALRQLEQGLRPDWVILDLNMPGLGGAATLEAMKALVPDLPIVLATGRADQVALSLAARFPQVHLLQKPFTIQELGARLGRRVG